MSFKANWRWINRL